MSIESQNQTAEDHGKPHTNEIHFTLDGEPYETRERDLTPNEIISRFAQKDPATHYLVQIEGHHRISYEGKGDEPIKIQNEMRCQVLSTGPTPVSAPA